MSLNGGQSIKHHTRPREQSPAQDEQLLDDVD